ncbi:MAG: hypothetical protein R3F43_08320 [bacterium]
MSEALAMDPPPQVVTDWLEVGGAFLQFAEDAGLVADERLVDAHRPFTQAIFLHHWLAPLRIGCPWRSTCAATSGRGSCAGRWSCRRRGDLAAPRMTADERCAPWRATRRSQRRRAAVPGRAAATRRWRGCGQPRSEAAAFAGRSSRRDEPGAPPAQLRPLRRAVRRHLHRPAAAEDRGPRRNPAR